MEVYRRRLETAVEMPEILRSQGAIMALKEWIGGLRNMHESYKKAEKEVDAI